MTATATKKRRAEAAPKPSMFPPGAKNTPPTRKDPTPGIRASAGSKNPPRAGCPPTPKIASPSGVEIPERAGASPMPTAHSPAPDEAFKTHPEGRTGVEAQQAIALGVEPPARPPTGINSMPTRAASGGGWLDLRAISEMHANSLLSLNQLRQRATAAGLDGDLLAPIITAQERVEHDLRLIMIRTMRRVAPAHRAWALETPGVGESTLARLLGVIGHPRIAHPFHWEGEGKTRVLIADPPFERNVAKLWAYCGYGDPERRKRKGMTADDAMALGNPRAKTLVYLVIEASLKAERFGAPYASAYRAARAHYAEARPEWTAGHQHAAAMRKAAKEFLLDLWRVDE